jgi:drug/metabolite transporter (DMT)-like permease
LGASRAAVYTALAAVYVLWGSTYLGILIAARTIPVFLLGAGRFLLAGVLLYLWAIRRGDRTDRPTLRHWIVAAVLGTGMLAIGNPAIAWAEPRVGSGIASLVIATVPLFMALLDRVAYGNGLGATAVAGLVVGFGGAALLAGPGGSHHLDVLAVVVLLLASLSWAAASLWSRHASSPRRPLVGAAMQMITAGLLLIVVGAASDEMAQLPHVSGESIAALAYLVVSGSLVGFTAYVWLLKAAPTSLVSTYAYANPVVAVFLGWAIESEPLGVRTLVAGAMILAAVALIVSARPARPRVARGAPAATPVRAR